MMKLSDYVMKFIADYGVSHVFMVAGGGAMHLDDSLGKCKRLQPVICLHEQAATIAAQASAQAGARIGVSLVTTGPGGTNAITGVAAAWTDSVPLLVISGQVKRSTMIGTSGLRSRGSQELNIVPVVKPITKFAVCVLEQDRIREYLEQAFYEATHGRPGPVWIDIPLDIQASMINETNLQEYSSPTKGQYEFNTNEVIKMLKASKRPVILAGHGIELANAQTELAEFLQKVKPPVLTTWRSLGLISEEDGCFCGRPGGIAQRGANIVQQKADFILAIGCRLDMDQVGFSYPNFARNARKIIVDIDQAELEKFSEMTDALLIKANAKEFLQKLLESEQLPEVDTAWRVEARKIYQRYPVMQAEYRNHQEGVNIYHLVDVLTNLAEPSDVISPGNSAGAPNCTFQAWRVKMGQKFICAAGFGSMGFGIPSALGSALANPNSRVFCLNGDGGWQLNTQELETIRRMNLNIKFFVLNNGGYASIRNSQRNYFNRLVGCDASSGLTLPDTLKVAAGYGILNLFSIKTGQGLESTVKQAINTPGPVVCEVIVTPEQIYAPRLVSKIVDGQFVTPSMENLWPEIPQEELSSMIAN